MDTSDMALTWAVAIGIFALGAGTGFVIAWLVLPHKRRCKVLAEELAQAREGQTEYREQVNQHFKKTAELFEQMTDGYRAIYQHLAAGAQTLCEEHPQSLQLDLPGHEKRDDRRAAASPPSAPDSDEAVRAQARPGDDIDESYLGDAPHVPELDEVVEVHPKSRPRQPNAPPQPERPADAPGKPGMQSMRTRAGDDRNAGALRRS